MDFPRGGGANFPLTFLCFTLFHCWYLPHSPIYPECSIYFCTLSSQGRVVVISWVSSFPQKEQMLTIADEGVRGGGGGQPKADHC